MYDFISGALPFVASAVTGLLGWLAGTTLRKNDTISKLMLTIDDLISKNKELIEKVTELRLMNSKLRQGQEVLHNEIEALKVQNKHLLKAYNNLYDFISLNGLKVPEELSPSAGAIGKRTPMEADYRVEVATAPRGKRGAKPRVPKGKAVNDGND